MASEVTKAEPTIPDAYIQQVLAAKRAVFEKHEGQVLCKIVVTELPDKRITLDADVMSGPPVDEMFQALIEKAKDHGDWGASQFFDEARERWQKYDAEEMLFCLVCTGYIHTQIRTLPKPWVIDADTETTPHEHHPCGVRVGAYQEYDEQYEDAFMFTRLGNEIDKQCPVANTAKAAGIRTHIAKAYEKEADPDRLERLAATTAGFLSSLGGDVEMVLSNAEKVLATATPPHSLGPKIIDGALDLLSRYHGDALDPHSVFHAAVQIEAASKPALVREQKICRRKKKDLFDASTPAPEGQVELVEVAAEHARHATFVDDCIWRMGELVRLSQSRNRYIATVARMSIPPLEAVCLADRPKGLTRLLASYAR